MYNLFEPKQGEGHPPDDMIDRVAMQECKDPDQIVRVLEHIRECDRCKVHFDRVRRNTWGIRLLRDLISWATGTKPHRRVR